MNITYRITLNLLLILLFNYSFAQYSWVRKNDFPGPSRHWSVAFTIGQKGYITTGSEAGPYLKDLWEYDPSIDSWTQKANFPGAARGFAFGFSINGKGYLCLGSSNGVNTFYNDVWEYNPANDQWIQKNNFPGPLRDYGVSFSIGDKGYIGCGRTPNTPLLNDFWQYDPLLDQWTQQPNIPTPGRCAATYYVINNKGYVGFGWSGASTNDLWEYDPSTMSWSQKSVLGTNYEAGGITFEINNNVYLGSGMRYASLSYFNNDFWTYNSTTGLWDSITPFPSAMRNGAARFSIANKGYMIMGDTSSWGLVNEVWEFSVGTTPLITEFTVDNDTICAGDDINFNDNSSVGISYNWHFPGGTPSTSNLPDPIITYNTAGTYDVKLVIVKDTLRDSLIKSQYITVLPVQTTNISYSDSIFYLNDANPLPIISTLLPGCYFSGSQDLVIDRITGEIDLKNSVEGLHTITYASSNYCTFNSIIKIRIEKRKGNIEVFSIPNIFTPNNDGYNDKFLIRGSGISDLNAKIFNRWGQKIYEWANINSYWDGKGSEEGTYYYRIQITLKGKTEIKTGFVTLTR